MESGRKGFTIIELMVVVIIIGVLVTVGYPSYVSYMISGRQASAKTGLEAARLAMETYYGRKGKYADASISVKDLPGYEGNIWQNMDPQARYSICTVESSKTSFKIKARCEPSNGCDIGNGELDVWMINELGDIWHSEEDPACPGGG